MVASISLTADPPSPDDVRVGAVWTARRGSSKHCHSSIFSWTIIMWTTLHTENNNNIWSSLSTVYMHAPGISPLCKETILFWSAHRGQVYSLDNTIFNSTYIHNAHFGMYIIPQVVNTIAHILGNYIHYKSDLSVENYEWQCLLDPLLTVCTVPLVYIISLVSTVCV